MSLQDTEPSDFHLLQSPKFPECTINGQKYVVGFCVNSPGAGGYNDDTMIWIADDVTDPEHFIEYGVHECLHRLFPKASEQQVHQAGRDIAAFLIGAFSAKADGPLPKIRPLATAETKAKAFPTEQLYPECLNLGLEIVDDLVTAHSFSRAFPPDTNRREEIDSALVRKPSRMLRGMQCWYAGDVERFLVRQREILEFHKAALKIALSQAAESEHPMTDTPTTKATAEAATDEQVRELKRVAEVERHNPMMQDVLSLIALIARIEQQSAEIAELRKRVEGKAQ